MKSLRHILFGTRPGLLAAVVMFTAAAIPVTKCAAAEAKVPARIELRDQNDKLHVITFPASRITVLCLADRHGRGESNQWAATLAAYKKRAAIHGIADAAGTPEFMKNSIRKRIQSAQKQDLLIDWTGATCAAIGCQPRTANLVIVSRSGTVLHRTTGAPTAENLKAFAAALEQALARSK